MKRLLISFLSFIVFPAFAVTSESYVDSAVNTLQNEIPAENTNTVLTNTGTAGEIGTKKIYDETQSFGTQTDALVTTETFNAAVQNAIDNEFVCIESIPEGCLLYKIQNTVTVADGYTRLEYIIPRQNINTQKQLGPNFEIYATVMITPDTSTILTNGSSFSVSTYSANLLASGVGGVFKNGGIRFPGVNQKFTFGISPTWVMHYGGTKTQLIRASNDNNNLWLSGLAKFYSIRLYNNGILDADFVPVRRNSDGRAGMYDTVSGNFVTNNSGKLTVGPDITTNIYLPSN